MSDKIAEKTFEKDGATINGESVAAAFEKALLSENGEELTAEDLELLSLLNENQMTGFF
jgi:hypothetical protein